jgi:hypothetical protein
MDTPIPPELDESPPQTLETEQTGELESTLLEGVRSPHRPYSTEILNEISRRQSMD